MLHSKITQVIPPKVRKYREIYRKTRIGASYRGFLHLGFTTLCCIFLIFFSLKLLKDTFWWEWSLVPFYFVFTNMAEYLGHRFPMHHKIRFLHLIFQKHTLEHHRFFTFEAPFFENHRDLKIVLFSPLLIIFFLSALAAPLAFLLLMAVSKNAAVLFFFAVLIHFLIYEYLHLYFHMPEGKFLQFMDKWALFRFLREHHRIHHHQKLMRKKNFNLTWPLMDFLAGTLQRAKK